MIFSFGSPPSILKQGEDPDAEAAPPDPDPIPAEPDQVPTEPEQIAAKPEQTPGVIVAQGPETFYLPLYIITAIFGAIFIFGPLLVRKGPDRPITRCCIMLSTFCLWLFWVTMYISQMNPLLGPRLHNSSVAWIGYAWGKNAKELGGALVED